MRLLNHIDDVSDTRGKVEVIVVLKSTVFIALYNCIEATAYSTLERIHDCASSLMYDELSDSFRKLLLRYSFGKTASAYVKDPVKAEKEVEKLRATAHTFPGLEAYLRRQTPFSGNLDARKLNVLAVSYGIAKMSFAKPDADRVLWIKNKRNRIAHGEQSMSHGGQGIKTAELRLAAQSVGVILRTFIDAADVHLRASAFRRPI